MERPKYTDFLNSWFWINFWNVIISMSLGLTVPIAIISSLFIVTMYLIEWKQYNKAIGGSRE